MVEWKGTGKEMERNERKGKKEEEREVWRKKEATPKVGSQPPCSKS